MTYVPQDKKVFLAKLQHFVDTEGSQLPDGYGRISYRPHRGELVLVQGVINYLVDPKIPDKDNGLNWFVDLGKYLVDAFEEFRTDPKWALLRDNYAREGYDIPSLTDARDRDRTLVAHQLARLMGLVSGETWLTANLEQRFNAEMQVIENAWRHFVRKARPVFARIKTEKHRGNKGVFGKTTIMSYACAGRVMFTFERDDVGQVSAVCDDSDMYGCRSGLNWPSATFLDAVTMINEVTDNWEDTKFKPDTKIGF